MVAEDAEGERESQGPGCHGPPRPARMRVVVHTLRCRGTIQTMRGRRKRRSHDPLDFRSSFLPPASGMRAVEQPKDPAPSFPPACVFAHSRAVTKPAPAWHVRVRILDLLYWTAPACLSRPRNQTGATWQAPGHRIAQLHGPKANGRARSP